LRLFLCVSPWAQTYPSDRHAGFDAENLVAEADGAVPLLWLALFRPADLSEDEATGTAPLATRERALANLAAAVPALDRLFGPPVSAHADLLRQALPWFPGDWLTIEWWDEERPAPPDPDELRAALATLDDPAGGPGPLLRLCELDPADLPEPPRPGAPLLPHLNRQAAGLRRILGRASHQLVPWEQPI